MGAAAASRQPGAGDAIRLNKRELARALGISEPSVTALIDDGCPVVRGGSNGVAYEFDLADVRRWKDDRDRAKAAKEEQKKQAVTQLTLGLEGGQARDDQHLTPKARIDWLNAELLTNKARTARGELVEAAAVSAEFEAVFKEIATFLQSIPDQMARRLDWAPGAVAECTDLIDEFQERLARRLMERKP